MLLLNLKTFILFIGSAFCVFPTDWSQEGMRERVDNWALTQVLIYYAEEFDQRLAPGNFFLK